MPRPSLSLAVLVSLSCSLFAADPRPDSVERVLGLQQAIADAGKLLNEGKSAEAVAILEAKLANADGNRAFLDLLRRGYNAELQRLETSPNTDPATLAMARRKLELLGGPVAIAKPQAAPAEPQAARGPVNPFRPTVVPVEPDLLHEARELFKSGEYAQAAAKFAAAQEKKPLSPDEAAAWAYCRIKVAAERISRPDCDAVAAAAAEKELTEAMAIVPDRAELQQLGKNLLAVARQRKAASPAASPAAAAVPADWQTLETPSFVIRFQSGRDVAEKLAKAAEMKREEIFKLWSGPPGGAWTPKCEVVLHPTAECYAKMTGKPAAGTGHATVRLVEGKAASRRIDLQADDAALVANALPRELTHVVLADLFPYTPPPRWAEEGMAVLAGSSEEIGRYLRTLPRCARKGELFTVAALLEMKDFPAPEKVTGFYCGSVSLVEYLVKLKGEKHFTTFLRDCQRYGTASALKRQYGIESPQALQETWLRAALDGSRAQAN